MHDAPEVSSVSHYAFFEPWAQAIAPLFEECGYLITEI